MFFFLATVPFDLERRQRLHSLCWLFDRVFSIWMQTYTSLFVSFCLNYIIKMNRDSLSTWSEIMTRYVSAVESECFCLTREKRARPHHPSIQETKASRVWEKQLEMFKCVWLFGVIHAFARVISWGFFPSPSVIALWIWHWNFTNPNPIKKWHFYGISFSIRRLGARSMRSGWSVSKKDQNGNEVHKHTVSSWVRGLCVEIADCLFDSIRRII